MQLHDRPLIRARCIAEHGRFCHARLGPARRGDGTVTDRQEQKTWETGATGGRASRVVARPRPLVLASAVLHVLALMVLVGQPAWWPWALCAVALDHLALVGAGLWPHSRLLGANIMRLPTEAAARAELALTFDDGPDPQITPAVLALLEAHDVRATFFCIGERARGQPALCREILRHGHALESHTERHRYTFSLLGPQGYRRELRAAQQSFKAIIGREPTFFRAPAGVRNLFLQPILEELGLRLVSWTRRGYDTRERDPEKVLKRLRRGLMPGAILLLHDGNAARTRDGRPIVLEVLPQLLEDIRRAGLVPVTLPTAHAREGVSTGCAIVCAQPRMDRSR